MVRLIRFPVFLALMLAGFVLQAQTQPQLLNLAGGNDEESNEMTLIEFEQAVYDLGTFQQGDTVKSSFQFTNIGEGILEIDNVKPSCRCAELTYPEEPIKPGGKGTIFAAIDTEDKSGEQTKFFTVIYNGNPPIERVKLVFFVETDEVKAPAPEAAGD